MRLLSCQVGLASISAGVQRAGGSRAHPGSALEEALELRAASIEGGASGESIAMGTPLTEHSTHSACWLSMHLAFFLSRKRPPRLSKAAGWQNCKQTRVHCSHAESLLRCPSSSAACNALQVNGMCCFGEACVMCNQARLVILAPN